MTRRKAALILASIIGVMSGKVKAEDQPPSWGTSGTTNLVKVEPMSVFFDLKGFKEYVFHFEGKTLTFTPDELFMALKD